MAIRIEKFMPLNWHFLEECDPLRFGRSTFITGVNASGKSTLIDAIRLLFFVTKTNFNKANAIARDKKSRSLLSYVYGADSLLAGSDSDNEETDRRFMRPGPTVTHVVAELKDDATKVHTVIGVTIEAKALGSNSQLNPVWWSIDNAKLDELEFTVALENGQRRFALLDEIKKMTPAGSAIRTNETPREAKQRFSIIFGLTDNRMGDEKALDAWAKTEDDAIAFDPKGMKDLDRFIKDHVLPKREIKTSEFLELLERHKELQKTAESLFAQCDRVKTIVDLADEYHLQSTKLRFLEIKIKLAKNAYLDQEIAQTQEVCDGYDRAVHKKEQEKRSLEDQRGAFLQTLAELKASMPNEALNRLEKLQAACNQDIKACMEKADQLSAVLATVRTYANRVNDLFGSPVVDMAFLEQYQEPREKAEEFEVPLFHRLTESLKKAQEEVEQTLHAAMAERQAQYVSIKALEAERSDLQKGLSVADTPSARWLKEAITADFKENGIQDEPKYLCELLELTDKTWAESAEAFMGGFRFAIMVMPENYLRATGVYKRICAANRDIYGVTLVDSTSFQQDEYEAKAGSLASLFTTENPYARSYLAYAYNHVTLVEDAANPPGKDGTFVSRDGMCYARRGFRRLRPVKLAIGAETRKLRLEECRRELAEKEEAYRLVQSQEVACNAIKKLQKQNENMNLFFANGRTLLEDSGKLRELHEHKAKLVHDLDKLKSASAMEQMRSIEADIAKRKEQIEAVDKELVDLNSSRKTSEKECTTQQEELNTIEEAIASWRTDYPADFDTATAEFEAEKAVSRKGAKGFAEALENDSANLSQTHQDLNRQIGAEQKSYTAEFATAYPTEGYASMEIYREAYHTISGSEIPNIKHKAEKAARQTRDKFEESILQSLRVAMDDADGMLSEINRYMSRMSYNGNIFWFTKASPADGRQDEFNMIRDKHNTGTDQGQATFDSLVFEDEYATKRARLFEAIEKGEENKNGVDLLDYRSYCKFGVSVRKEGGDASTVGKLGEMVISGSGSEVQVPCYIILTAALVQKYNRANRLRGEINDSKALRIILVDECFDRMDAANVKKMLHFMTKDMGIQVIASAPTNMFPTVGVHMDAIVFVKSDPTCHWRECYSFTAPAFEQLLESVGGMETDGDGAVEEADTGMEEVAGETS